MAEPDVLLDEQKTRVVGPFEVGGGETGEPVLTMDPSVRELVLQTAAGDRPTRLSPDRIRTREFHGIEVGLGGGRDFEQKDDEGRVRVNRGGDQDLEPKVGVDIRGGNATVDSTTPAGISVHRNGSQVIDIAPDGIEMSGGEIVGPDRVEAGETLRVGGVDDSEPSRRLEKGEDGGSRAEQEYRAGELSVQSDTGRDGEADTTVKIEGAPSGTEGGRIGVYQAPTLRTGILDGGSGTLHLGANRAGLGLTRESGVSGSITLATGDGSHFEVTAAGGTLTVSLVDSGPLLEIDTNAEEIRTKYEISEGVL